MLLQRSRDFISGLHGGRAARIAMSVSDKISGWIGIYRRRGKFVDLALRGWRHRMNHADATIFCTLCRVWPLQQPIETVHKLSSTSVQLQLLRRWKKLTRRKMKWWEFICQHNKYDLKWLCCLNEMTEEEICRLVTAIGLLSQKGLKYSQDARQPETHIRLITAAGSLFRMSLHKKRKFSQARNHIWEMRENIGELKIITPRRSKAERRDS